MTARFEALKQFLTTDIWRIGPDDVSALRYFFYNVIKILYLSIKFFTTKRIMDYASALTYSSLLAVVPICAVVFAIARGFGYSKYIEVWFRGALESQPQAAETIIGFVNSYLVHTKSGVFLGIGLLFMLWTIIMLTRKTELTFNDIWNVKSERTIVRTFVDYIAMFFIIPIMIVLTSGLSIYIATIADKAHAYTFLGTVMEGVIALMPYVIMSIVFILFYVFMPNTNVKLRATIGTWNPFRLCNAALTICIYQLTDIPFKLQCHLWFIRSPTSFYAMVATFVDNLFVWSRTMLYKSEPRKV